MSMTSTELPEFCEPARSIFIAIPSYSARPVAELMTSLHTAAQCCADVGIELHAQVTARDPYLDRVRNYLVTQFISSPATDLLFWDDDVAPVEPDCIVKVAQARRPFVGGLYPKKMQINYNEDLGKFVGELEWPSAFKPGATIDEDGLLEMVGMPTGFLRLSRCVFDYMPCNFYTDEDLGRKILGYFSTGIHHGQYWGEDSLFSFEWHRRGGKIFCVPDITFRHIGMCTWKMNLAEYLKTERGQLVLTEKSKS